MIVQSIRLKGRDLLTACRNHRVMSAQVVGPRDGWWGQSALEIVDIEGCVHHVDFFYSDERDAWVQPADAVGMTVGGVEECCRRRDIAWIKSWR